MRTSGHIDAKKRLGQHFLTDLNIVAKIVRVSEVKPGDRVLEIGPGEGVMTAALLDAGCLVTAIELDAELIPLLSERFADRGTFNLIHADVLRTDLRAVLSARPADAAGRASWHVVANLPYYITTPIMFKLLEECRGLLTSMTLMVQKEVASRIVAPPGGKDYGALTVSVHYHSMPSIKMTVPPSAFRPRPGVDSAVIRLLVREQPPAEVGDEKLFFTIVKAAFAQRRKTLRNTLASGLASNYHPDVVAAAITSAGIDPSRRGETLSVEEFAAISRALSTSR